MGASYRERYISPGAVIFNADRWNSAKPNELATTTTTTTTHHRHRRTLVVVVVRRLFQVRAYDLPKVSLRVASIKTAYQELDLYPVYTTFDAKNCTMLFRRTLFAALTAASASPLVLGACECGYQLTAYGNSYFRSLLDADFTTIPLSGTATSST